MSDFESEDAESGDFSASEDEWNPEQTSGSDSASDFENATDSSPLKSAGKASKKIVRKPNHASTGLNTRNKPLSGSLKEILAKAKASRQKQLNVSEDKSAQPGSEDDSASSGDEHLVDPANLRFDSKFFETKPSGPAAVERIPTPVFDCNIGVKSSDSDSDEDDEFLGFTDISVTEQNTPDNNTPLCEPTTAMAFDKLDQFSRDMDLAKKNLKSYNENKKCILNESVVDVGRLLALGEAIAPPQSHSAALPTKGRKRAAAAATVRQHQETDDSDWEEVEGASETNKEKKDDELLGDIHVALDMPGNRHRQKIQNEIELALKRQMNKVKREQQLELHKQGIKDWVEQGNHINSILNDASLFQLALKFLPSAHAYPKDKADRMYFKNITKFYTHLIKLAPKAEKYPSLKDDLDIRASLRQQLNTKSANSRRNFILMFVILLRAMGIQCRMVVNLNVPPIRPPTSELCRISSTIPKESGNSKAKTNSKPKATRKSKGRHDTTSTDSSDDDDYDEIVKKISSKKPSRKIVKEKVESNVQPTTKTRDKSTTSTQSTRPPRKSDDTPSTSKTENPKPPSRSTRSSRKKVSVGDSIPQLDGLDDVTLPSPRVTRSRSKTPIPSPRPSAINSKKKVIHTDSSESPIKRSAPKNPRLKLEKLMVIKEHPKPEKSSGQESTQLFAVDPSEKKTVKKSIQPEPKPGTSSAGEKRKLNKIEEVVVSKKPKQIDQLKAIDRRVLSTDDDENEVSVATKDKSNKKNDFWVEVWLERQEKWACVDLFKVEVDCINQIVRSTTVPIAYVLAWNNDSSIKDVSLRYCPQWHSVNKKQRVEQEWLDKVLQTFKGTATASDIQEDAELSQLVHKRPMPTAISEFKNHPLYALERHLLKFEAIYPPDAPTMGFVRGEPIYARECVHTLHSRELWVKQARVVKPSEYPYKIVMARPKWDRATSTVIKDIPLEIFGHWQTNEYEPPVAENGIVPRNAYGNVELFKECMLPINTVHLPYPGLNRVCKKLNIDCANAVVGFDFHGGYSHPVYEGFVVCKEFAELVTDAWIKDTEEAERKREEKHLDRVYGNWKRLIKGLLIRKRLQLKYNFGTEENDDGTA